MQKLKCPTCGRILGGKATTKKNGNTYFYYRCLVCKNNIQESSIEKSFIEILNDVVEYDGTFNNDSKMLSIKMPDNYDIVRIFPTEEKTETEILNMGAICISKDLSQEIDYDIEFADEILIDKYKEISKCNDEDIISVGN